MPTVTEYDYTKAPVALDSLQAQIQASSIITALDHMIYYGGVAQIFFKDALSTGDKTTLDTVVAAHNGVPLPQTLPPTDTKGRPVVTTSPFGMPSDFTVKATGVQWGATSLTAGTHNFDYAIGSEDRYINGVQMVLAGHQALDTVSFQVVDKDGVYAPAGTVLGQFGLNWNVTSNQDQGQIEFNFVAKIPALTYVRVVYTSALPTPTITLGMNMFLYKKVP